MDEETTAGTAAPEGGAEATQQAESQVDLSPVFDRLDEMSGMVKDLGTRIPAPEPEAEPDPFEGWDGEGLFGEPDPQAQDQARRALADAVTRGSQAEANRLLGPAMQRLEKLEVQTNMRALEAEFPQMDSRSDQFDAELTAQVVDEAHDLAYEMASTLGLDETAARRLAQTPRLIRAAFKATTAGKAASAETPADGAVTELEAGGGSSPGGSGAGKSIIDEVLEERRGSQVLPAWAR